MAVRGGYPNEIAGIDILVIALFSITSLIFLWDAPSWAPNVYIGHDQFGDADFWWQGVLEMSQGVLWDNVNFTFRMGYAIFAGLLVTLFGPNYANFHTFLIGFFVAVASAVYITGVPRIGRVVAFALAASLVFSPLLATHLSISTSDGLGMVFNVMALLALWRAFGDSRRMGALAAAGIFIALAALTRPFMTIFAAPAVLLIFVFTKGPFRARLARIAIFILALAIVMLTWTTAFFIKTGSVGLAGHDASIFYAASDPNYQVWNSSMYPPIEKAARERLGAASVSELQIDDEFRRQTLANYQKYFYYHLKRLPATIFAVAGFSFQKYNPTDNSEFLSRLLVRGLLALALAASCLAERRWFGCAAALTIFGVSIWPAGGGSIAIVSAIAFILPVRSSRIGAIQRLTATYWWAGVSAIFVTGGTWGPPLFPYVDINSLGYRLAAQFIFANDWLILLGLTAAVGLPRFFDTWLQQYVGQKAWLSWIDGPRKVRLVRRFGIAVLAILYLTGLSVFGARAWQRGHAIPVSMPPVAPLISRLCSAAGDLQPEPIEAQPASILYKMWGEGEPAKRLDGLRVFTGATGGLIWQLAGQNRTRTLFYQQDVSSPFEFNHYRADVEFYGLLPEDQWRNRSGAWFVRSFREAGPHVGYLYYQTLPKVQMFVPLTADGKSFDLTEAIKFPLARYASILAFNGHLTPVHATLNWLKYQSADSKRRWFILEPSTTAQTDDIAIDIDVNDAIGSRALSFSFRVEPVPGNPLSSNKLSISVQSVDAAGQTRTLIARTSSAHGGAVDGIIEDVSAAIADDAKRVHISFHGVGAKEMVRVIELNLISDDVTPGIVGRVCTQP
jgi:hypothetical protein